MKMTLLFLYLLLTKNMTSIIFVFSKIYHTLNKIILILMIINQYMEPFKLSMKHS